MYKTSTAVGPYDRFTVTVTGSTVGSESHQIYASNYSGLCASNIVIRLSKDYANQTVKVTIRRNPYSTVPMYIDNVTLWAGPY